MMRPQPTQYTKSRKAFTLIELLVVVAIIAVLVAVLLPALSKTRRQAKLLTCGNQMRQWGTSLVSYASDQRDWFPCTGRLGSWWWGDRYTTEYGGYFTSCTPFVNLMYPEYVVSRALFVCPFEPVRPYQDRWPPWVEFYGFSYAYMGSYGSETADQPASIAKRCKTLTDPPRGIMSDQHGWDPRNPNWYWNHDPEVYDGFKYVPSTVNLLYTDGHVVLLPVYPYWYSYGAASMPGL